jgi:hypothetical protein
VDDRTTTETGIVAVAATELGATTADGTGALRHAGVWTRIAPVASGCALAAAALFVATNDPSAPGSRFPVCGFHAATGLWCPGCGLTRATHHLLTGDLGAALSSNVFTPFVLSAIVLSWAVWTLGAFGREIRNPITRMPAWAGPALVVVVFAFGVVRNLPGPWSALAP